MSSQQRCFHQRWECDYFSQTPQWSALACHFAHFILLPFDTPNVKKAVVGFRNTLSDISTMKCMVCMVAFTTSVCNKVAMHRGGVWRLFKANAPSDVSTTGALSKQLKHMQCCALASGCKACHRNLHTNTSSLPTSSGCELPHVGERCGRRECRLH